MKKDNRENNPQVFSLSEHMRIKELRRQEEKSSVKLRQAAIKFDLSFSDNTEEFEEEEENEGN